MAKNSRCTATAVCENWPIRRVLRGEGSLTIDSDCRCPGRRTGFLFPKGWGIKPADLPGKPLRPKGLRCSTAGAFRPIVELLVVEKAGAEGTNHCLPKRERPAGKTQGKGLADGRRRDSLTYSLTSNASHGTCPRRYEPARATRATGRGTRSAAPRCQRTPRRLPSCKPKRFAVFPAR